MGLIANTINDFSGGLVNSRANIEGSLVLSENAIYTYGGIRQRGPITEVSTLEASASTTNQKLVTIGALDQLVLATSWEDGANTNAYVSTNSGSSWTDLGVLFWSGAGGTFQAEGGAVCVSVGDELIFGGSTSSSWWDEDANDNASVIRWSGAAISAYSTGNITTTAGSNVVNGGSSAPVWTSALENAYLSCSTSFVFQRIKRVISATQLELYGPAPEVVTNSTYVITSMGPISAKFMGPVIENYWAWDGGSSYGEVRTRCIGSHQGRLFLGATVESTSSTANKTYNRKYGSRIRWSALIDEDVQQTGASVYATGAGAFHRTAYADIGAGIGGDICGLHSLDRYLVVLKDSALFILSGSFTTDDANSSFSSSRVPGAPGCVGVQASASGPYGVAYLSNRGLILFDGRETRNVSGGRVVDIDNRVMSVSNAIVSSVGNRIFVYSSINGSGSPYQRIYVYDVSTDAWTFFTHDMLLSPIVEDNDGRELSIMYDSDTDDLVLANHATEIDQTVIVGSNAQDLGSIGYPSMQFTTSAIPLGDSASVFGRPKYIDVEFGNLIDASENDFGVTVYVGNPNIDTGTLTIPPNPLNSHGFMLYGGILAGDQQYLDGSKSIVRFRLIPSRGDNDGSAGIGGDPPAYGSHAFVNVYKTSGTSPYQVNSVTIHSTPVRRQFAGG